MYWSVDTNGHVFRSHGGAGEEPYLHVVVDSDGVEWTRVAEDAFPARAMHNSVVLGDRMFVFGGGVYDPGFLFNTVLDYNDVWSSEDGVTWDKLGGMSADGWR